MTSRVTRSGLGVGEELAAFVEEALPGSGITPEAFWNGFAALLRDLTPRNRALLARRETLQRQIDDYHRTSPGRPDPQTYRAMLEHIGYLSPEPADVSVTTSGVDREIVELAGPQLVVPLLNARFAINAVNARWGSLYDALYGTDAIVGERDTAEYDPVRGDRVVARGRALLDLVAPLKDASHADVTSYRVEHGSLIAQLGHQGTTNLRSARAFAGYRGGPAAPDAILLRHHGLHLELVIDRTGPIGRNDPAGVQDLVVESAVTTIMDLEDSVVAVDSEDKALGYRNWHGLMLGTLKTDVQKGGRRFTRSMNADRHFTAPEGDELVLPGRSLLFIRNVGHLMTTGAVLDDSGDEVFEGMLDAVMTTLGALPDLRGESELTNSRTGSLYIVKPKMHGPEEVAFAVELFARVEQLLDLPPRTIKIGIMDEERRTSVNLAACIAAASDRVVFINTGFLDRTGDEIRTSLHAGIMVPKGRMRGQGFLRAYEDANVDSGLRLGLPGHAQIGKGMWPMPELMADMLDQKIDHVRAGATAAWVPSPTAATLHALHYHEVDVFAVQKELAQRPRRPIDEMLDIPLAEHGEIGEDERLSEIDENVQSILGYVVRWVDQGIGCSKVPDIHDVSLMEDRATLRISSQLLANWLAHGFISRAEVDRSLVRLAAVVDAQNAGDARYEPLLGEDGSTPGLAFDAARRLIVDGAAQPNGYTEPLLHQVRRQKKSSTPARTSGETPTSP